MDVDYTNIATHVHCIENCKPIQEQAGAPIVNVDANFPIPAALQGQDGVFPRLQQGLAAFKAAEKAGRVVNVGRLSEKQRQTRPYRKPDYADEWKSLRKAWSLSRKGKNALSDAIIKKASGQFYPADPLTDLSDWLWRFAMFVCNPQFEPDFLNSLKEVQKLYDTPLLAAFGDNYNQHVGKRGLQYLGIMDEFFNGFSEFSQVYFSVARGEAPPTDMQATSIGFDEIKMFYGNTFEQFASLVDYLAMMNNMLAGRAYNLFEKMSLEEYRKLDKANRFNAFAANGPLTSLCQETDNQIRNASHHGSLSFSSDDQMIRFRVGKGGSGPEHELSYVSYLERCVRLFLQAMTLFRLELMVAHHRKFNMPI
jgi:hypothetical protein